MEPLLETCHDLEMIASKKQIRMFAELWYEAYLDGLRYDIGVLDYIPENQYERNRHDVLMFGLLLLNDWKETRKEYKLSKPRRLKSIVKTFETDSFRKISRQELNKIYINYKFKLFMMNMFRTLCCHQFNKKGALKSLHYLKHDLYDRFTTTRSVINTNYKEMKRLVAQFYDQ